MKKIIATLVLVGTLAFAGAADKEHIDTQAVNIQTKNQTICTNNAKKFLDIERSGCCSWHGGVAGCGINGRVNCNDGTYSPTCTCVKPTTPTI